MHDREVHIQILGNRKEILEEFEVGVDEETSGEIIGNVEIL